MEGVYIIHFLEPYKHAAHYTGFSPEVQARVNAHLNGKGARLTEVVHEAGIEMVLVRTWEGAGRKFERKLKNNGHIRRHCPICCGMGVQLPLLSGSPAYVPTATESAGEVDTAVVPAESQMTFDDYALEVRWYVEADIDIDAELEDLREGRADEDYWRTGNW